VTLATTQLPAHSHSLSASTAPGAPDPAGKLLAADPNVDLYRESAGSAQLAAASILPAGGSLPHSNLQPYLCVTFIIALFGIFPSRN
jgi:microcystin-dependent protein